MKKLTTTGLIMMTAATAHAATIINSSILNGNFESGFDADPDTVVDNWTTGLNAQSNQFRNGPSTLVGTVGDVTAVLGQQSAAFGGLAIGVLQNTGFIVTVGQTFDLSFDWANAFQWAAADTVDWRLFTTSDNTVGGTLTLIASGTNTADNNTDANTFQSESFTGIGTVTAPSDGQQLWIEFSATQGGESDGYFARLDNVVLTAIPEPSAGLLLVAAGALCVSRRRR